MDRYQALGWFLIALSAGMTVGAWLWNKSKNKQFEYQELNRILPFILVRQVAPYDWEREDGGS